MNSADSSTSIALPPSHYEIMVARILDLQEALQKQLPGYESILYFIHTQLQLHKDTVHLLTDEQIGIICAGLSKRTGVYIAAAETTSSKKKGKTTLEDL